MARPPILIEVVVAIRGGPLDPGRAWLPQEGLKNNSGEAFAGGDENWRGGLPFRANNGQHLQLPWHVGEGANGEFLAHIISREASELGGVALFHRRLLSDDLFVANGGIPLLELGKQF